MLTVLAPRRGIIFLIETGTASRATRRVSSGSGGWRASRQLLGFAQGTTRLVGLSRKSADAFTIVELLVVISIITILAVLTVPALQRGLESAKVTSDLSNLRQLGTAINLYANDHEHLPGQNWPTELHPLYVSSWRVFRSAFDPRKPSSDGNATPVSFDMNFNVRSLKPSSIVSPVNCILFAPLTANTDDVRFLGTAWQPGLPSPLNNESNGQGATGGTYSRGTQTTVLFGDLHAASIPMRAFHCSLPNPNPYDLITDLRWNE